MSLIIKSANLCNIVSIISQTNLRISNLNFSTFPTIKLLLYSTSWSGCHTNWWTADCAFISEAHFSSPNILFTG